MGSLFYTHVFLGIILYFSSILLKKLCFSYADNFLEYKTYFIFPPSVETMNVQKLDGFSCDFWGDAPYPGLYRESIGMPLCRDVCNIDSQAKLILVHHIHEQSLPFINALSKSYRIHKVIGIPYSSIPSAVNKLCDRFDVTVPDSLEDISLLVKNEVLNCDDKIIIQEIGGYSSEVADFLDRSENVLGIVEDTNQGYWRWMQVRLTRLPVLSIAASIIKKPEEYYVGQSVVDGIAKFLKISNLAMLKQRKILIIGYGNIGSKVTKYLKPICRSLAVYDLDPIRLLCAQPDYEITRELSKYDLIVGATGNPSHSVHADDVGSMSSDTLLISASSRRVEFDIQGFRNKSDFYTEDSNLIWSYHFGNKKIHVANMGEPINFRYSRLPNWVLDLVYSGAASCINQIANGNYPPGVHDFSVYDSRMLAKQYLQLYGEFLEDVLVESKTLA